MPVPATLIQNINFNSPASSSELAFELKNYVGGVLNKEHNISGSVDFKVFSGFTSQGAQPTVVVHSLFPLPAGYNRVIIRFEYEAVNSFSLLATYKPITINPATKAIRQGDGVINMVSGTGSDKQPIGFTVNTEITMDTVFVTGKSGSSMSVSEGHYAGVALTNVLEDFDSFSSIRIKEFRIINTPFPSVKITPASPVNVSQSTTLLTGENIGGMYGSSTIQWTDNSTYASGETAATIATPINNATQITGLQLNAASSDTSKNYLFNFSVDDNIGTEWSFVEKEVTVVFNPSGTGGGGEPSEDDCSVCILGITKTPTGILILPTVGANYEYSLDGVSFQSSPQFDNIIGGNYTLTARDISDRTCSKEFEFSIFKLVPPGDQSQFTLSYSPKIKAWASFHDYTPSYMIELTNQIISINNKLEKKFYSHNDVNTKARYYLQEAFESVIEQPVNLPDLSKFYSYNWETEVYTLSGVYKFLETFTSMLIYNNRYCSSYITKLKEVAGNDEDVFSFNKAFNDLRLADKAFLDRNGKPKISLLGRSNIKQGHIRGKFIIIKMIYDNVVQRELYVKNISAKTEKDGLQEK